MKKFYFSLVVALLFSLSALANNVIVKGYVTYSNGSPVVNRSVWIMTDSLTTSPACFQGHQVHTNANGFYIDTLNCPNGSIVKVRIQLENCNGTYIVENPQVNTTTNIVERNFTLACNPTCNADFVFTKQNLTAAFTSTSTVSGSTAINFYWNFGDGGTSALANPIHTYSAAGTYNVTLMIASNGCSDTVVKAVTLTGIDTSCHANFTYNINGPQVFFTNQSTAATGTITYQWQFGDGYSSTGVNTGHPYSNNGVYNVKLKMVTSAGCIDSIMKTITINTNQLSCNAQFTSQQDSGNSRKYHFNSTSTTGPGDSITYIMWRFSRPGTNWYDSIPNIKDPNYVFPDSGFYSVCLYIYTAANCFQSICKDIYVGYGSGPGCQANFTYTIGTGGLVTFTNTSVVNAPATQQLWEFGNGIFSTTTNAFYTYQPGTHTACLTISTSLGCSDSVCKTFTIAPPTSCVSQFSFQRLNTTPGYHVAFNSSASAGSTPNDAIVSRSWTFGDGQQLAGNVVSPTHMYTAQGTYTVCLKITTAAGCIKTECKQVILVDSNNCHANFSFAIGTGGAVMFTNTSNTLGTSAQYVWSFGTQATSSAINPVYTFAPGTYNVCLRVYSGNCMDSVCKTIVIAPPASNCEAVFQYTGLPAGTNGYALQFNSAQSHATTAANDTIRERIWIWGDGTTTGGNIVSPLHTYSSAAVYNVCLVIRTSGGCSDTTCKTVTVPMPNQLTCKSQFTYEHLPATSATGRSVRFNSSTSTAGYGDSIISRKWTFGDGTSLLTGNVISPVHVYAQPGTYSACLTITTALGCTKTECKVVVVPQVAGNCVPHFTWTRTGPKQISFNSSSSWAPANDSIIERKWQFGDASPLLAGNIVSPVHNYQYNGIYTVTLKIRTALNCEKTFYGVVPVQDSINVNPVNQDRIRIVSLYPTPATYQMQAVVWSLQNNIQAELAIYDIYGTKKWSTNKVLFQGNNVTVVPTGFLAPGPYYFRVTTIFGVKSKPFFKQ